MASGLRVNVEKSEIIPVGNVENIDALTTFFGCRTACLPSSYLGLPLGAKYKSKALWNPVLDRFERRLMGWESSCCLRQGDLL